MRGVHPRAVLAQRAKHLDDRVAPDTSRPQPRVLELGELSRANALDERRSFIANDVHRSECVELLLRVEQVVTAVS
jgi:hypothetical protein